MIKPDVIVVHPRTGIDYPMWRWYMNAYQNSFDHIYVVVTMQGEDKGIAKFLKDNLPPNAVVLEQDYIPDGSDWRSAAVNQALKLSTAEWVWFMEQDLLFTSDFYANLINTAEHFHKDIVGILETNNRLHPACLLVKRSIIDQTPKDFAADPPDYDHFDQFVAQIKKLGEVAIMTQGYHHLNGLSHNYHIVEDRPRDVYRVNEFTSYNLCLSAVPVEPYPPFAEKLKRINFYLAQVEEIKKFFEDFLK